MRRVQKPELTGDLPDDVAVEAEPAMPLLSGEQD
jgi:hypothetical protein